MTLDWWGRELICPTPRPYPDARMPTGIRYERCHRDTCGACGAQKILTIANAIALSPLCQSGVVTLPSLDE